MKLPLHNLLMFFLLLPLISVRAFASSDDSDRPARIHSETCPSILLPDWRADLAMSVDKVRQWQIGQQINSLQQITKRVHENQKLTGDQVEILGIRLQHVALIPQRQLKPHRLELLTVAGHLTFEELGQDMRYAQFTTKTLFAFIEFFQVTSMLNSEEDLGTYMLRARVYSGLAKMFAEASRRALAESKMQHVRAAMVSTISASICLEKAKLSGGDAFFEAPLELIQAIVETHSTFRPQDLVQVREVILPLLVDESLLRIQPALGQTSLVGPLVIIKKILLLPEMSKFGHLTQRIDRFATALQEARLNRSSLQ